MRITLSSAGLHRLMLLYRELILRRKMITILTSFTVFGIVGFMKKPKYDQFEQRYLQERRRIEHALRQETEAKRQEQLPALRERLKKEFQEPSPSGPSTSAPGVSTSPKK